MNRQTQSDSWFDQSKLPVSQHIAATAETDNDRSNSNDNDNNMTAGNYNRQTSLDNFLATLGHFNGNSNLEELINPLPFAQGIVSSKMNSQSNSTWSNAPSSACHSSNESENLAKLINEEARQMFASSTGYSPAMQPNAVVSNATASMQQQQKMPQLTSSISGMGYNQVATSAPPGYNQVVNNLSYNQVVNNLTQQSLMWNQQQPLLAQSNAGMYPQGNNVTSALSGAFDQAASLQNFQQQSVAASGVPTTLNNIMLGQHQIQQHKPNRPTCSHPNCTNRIVQGGLCISHGARRKTCSHPGCKKHVKKAGRCSAHGPARKRCEHEGCIKVAVQGGRCIAHGAKKRFCSIEECPKQGILGGMCKKHYDMAHGIVKVRASKKNANVTSEANSSDEGSM